MSEDSFDNLCERGPTRRISVRDKAALVLSSWFGVGLIPKAPGTWGTLASIPLVICLSYLGIWPSCAFLAIFILIAVLASGIGQRVLGRDDPPEVVIDEVAGFLLTTFFLPLTWLSLLSGFVLFRLFDILKPFPIKRAEKIAGGTGIVLDDLLAGIYAHLGVRLILFLLGQY